MHRHALARVLPVVLGASMAAAAPGDPFVSWTSYGVAEGLPSDKVFAVLVDGPSVWAGTERGLAELRHGRVRVLGTEEGLPFPAVTALALDDASGDLWIGTMGGAARLSGGRIEAFTQLNSGLANDVVYGLTVTPDHVWFATASGLSRYDKASRLWSIFDTTNTLMHEPWTYGVTHGGDVVYVAVWGGGVLEHDPRSGAFRDHRDPDGEMEIDLFRDDGLVHDVVSSVSVDGDLMWVGTYFGLSRYDGRRWRSFSADDSGLASDFINVVRAAGGTVWIGTDRGLNRYDGATWHSWRRGDSGRFEHEIRTEAGGARVSSRPGGFADNSIYAIDLENDDVWLATAHGLVHGIAAASTGRTKEKTHE